MADALIFEGPGGPYRLRIEANYQPKAVIYSTLIDFGEVADWESAAPGKATINNKGTKDWTAEVRVNSKAYG
jgi:hypothetical protein